MKIIATGILLVLLFACGQPSTTPSPSPATPTKSEAVEVSAEGTKFDPPVPLEQIPTGAWSCVMKGKVHYSALEKGDGRCKVCGMNLVQQP